MIACCCLLLLVVVVVVVVGPVVVAVVAVVVAIGIVHDVYSCPRAAHVVCTISRVVQRLSPRLYSMYIIVFARCRFDLLDLGNIISTAMVYLSIFAFHI